MEQNKTSRYFKYAIGEVILVVIGILIAVQINSWVGANKLKKDNKVFLEKMISELELNKQRMDRIVNGGFSNRYVSLKQAVANCDSLLKMTYRGLQESDLPFILKESLGAGGSYLNLHNSIYEELLNTGKLYTLGSDKLITAIKEYYKRCEREDLYNKGNTKGMDKGFDLIENSYYKLKMDYYLDSLNFDINNYEWFFNTRSEQYQNLQIGISNIRGGQSNNAYKMEEISRYSDTLIKVIKNEIKNEY